jgi:predicted Zn-dependent peptidase
MEGIYNKTILDSGLTVITEQISYSPISSIGVFIKAGSVVESEENNGICHFIEHMVFKGTKNRTSYDISYEIERKGGYLNAYTSKEMTCFYAKVLNSEVENALDILIDIVKNPTFDPKEIKKESKVVVDEINDIMDTPEEFVNDLFEENLYSTIPLRNTVLGKKKNILNFTQDDLLGFINKYYVAENMIVVLVGNMEHNDFVKLVQKYEVENKKIAYLRGMEDLKYSVFKKTKSVDYQQAHVMLGMPVAGMKDKNRMKYNLFSTILGEGSASILFQKVREQKGITYQISSFINSYYDVSTFGIYFSTNYKKYQKVIDIIYTEFNKLQKKGVKQEDFDRAKDYLKGVYLMQLENLNERMFRLANNEFYYSKNISINGTFKQIENVTIDDINSIIDIISVDKLSLLVLK